MLPDCPTDRNCNALAAGDDLETEGRRSWYSDMKRSRQIIIADQAVQIGDPRVDELPIILCARRPGSRAVPIAVAGRRVGGGQKNVRRGIIIRVLVIIDAEVVRCSPFVRPMAAVFMFKF